MFPESLRRTIEYLGDRINPLLVKETRQALKSRQFTSTFMLLLAASLTVSYFLVAYFGPDIDYQSTGSWFFIWFFGVLAFAIFVVVPFGAYRSLASEQEERTFELLSITTLRPGQIITGKLLSAMTQMFIYYSAIAPFMAFTYLLKGIDVFSIVFIMILALLGSMGLSMIGLFLATFASRRSWQVMLSVVMICGLAGVTIGGVALAGLILFELGGMTSDWEFWVVMGVLATIYVTTYVLLFQLSISQMTFEADNRSSKVRLAILFQFLVGLAWLGYGWIIHSEGHADYLFFTGWVVAVYWAFMGAFLAAEPDGMSRRVARQVPRNIVTRAVSGLFYPGPNTGLAFLLVNLAVYVGMYTLAELTETWAVQNWSGRGRLYSQSAVTATLASYVFIYVALGALIVRFVRRYRPMPIVGGAALVIILLAFGSAIPNIIALSLRQRPYDTYALWQITDPGATINEITRAGTNWFLVGIVIALAGLMFVLNLRALGRSVADIEIAGRQNRLPDDAPFVEVADATQPLTATAIETAAGV
jgi:ABC-type transport system involved in cytochrome c biogenesis permease component